MKTFLYFTKTPTFSSRVIRFIAGPWSHVGIGFEHDNGSCEVFEAHYNSSFRGPKPFDLIESEIAEQSGTIECIDVPVDSTISERFYDSAMDLAARPLLTYGLRQLISHWAFERFGHWFGLSVSRSPNMVTCAEAVGFILHPDFDLRTKSRTTFDSLTPNSVYVELKKKIRIQDSVKQ